jgi:mRNA-degrading endonuclease RelE of RelBE toxin-antitoxin system
VTSRTTRRFRKSLEELPQQVRAQAREAYRRFRDDPTHPSLQVKKVHPSLPIYSARVSRDYRAVAVVEQDEWIWFFIGSHADYDFLLRQL